MLKTLKTLKRILLHAAFTGLPVLVALAWVRSYVATDIIDFRNAGVVRGDGAPPGSIRSSASSEEQSPRVWRRASTIRSGSGYLKAETWLIQAASFIPID